MRKNLVEGFEDSVEKSPNKIAIEIGDEHYAYAQLDKKVTSLACYLNSLNSDNTYVGILSSRSISAYTGILATLKIGKAYVPFDLNSPKDRLLKIISLARINTFILDDMGLEVLASIQEDLCASFFIVPEKEVNLALRKQYPEHTFIDKNDLMEIEEPSDFIDVEKNAVKADAPAYLLFTSGSTGEPKGVVIKHKNICSYLDSLLDHYPLEEKDRCTQAFDLTFDPSVHDMFATWFSGATLCVMSERQRFGAAKFIKDKKISVWNTIPSLVKLQMQSRSFNESNYGQLRYVFFNGEALTNRVASAAQIAAPHASLINLYGLTETTINLAHYHWKENGRGVNSEPEGIVPIGQLFSGNNFYLDDSSSDQRNEGELLLSGPQVFDGYLQTELNEQVFSKQESGQILFRTGDLVRLDEEGNLNYLNRLDDQVKINGYRVDLNEIRVHLQKANPGSDSIVLNTPNKNGDIQLLAFVLQENVSESSSAVDEEGFLSDLKANLPTYMLPSKIIILNEFPYLVSGKIDRKSLLKLAENE